MHETAYQTTPMYLPSWLDRRTEGQWELMFCPALDPCRIPVYVLHQAKIQVVGASIAHTVKHSSFLHEFLDHQITYQ
jgi:hypothetical protein